MKVSLQNKVGYAGMPGSKIVNKGIAHLCAGIAATDVLIMRTGVPIVVKPQKQKEVNDLLTSYLKDAYKGLGLKSGEFWTQDAAKAIKSAIKKIQK